jgi:hypothetical protein
MEEGGRRQEGSGGRRAAEGGGQRREKRGGRGGCEPGVGNYHVWREIRRIAIANTGSSLHASTRTAANTTGHVSPLQLQTDAPHACMFVPQASAIRRLVQLESGSVPPPTVSNMNQKPWADLILETLHFSIPTPSNLLAPLNIPCKAAGSLPPLPCPN